MAIVSCMLDLCLSYVWTEQSNEGVVAVRAKARENNEGPLVLIARWLLSNICMDIHSN